MLIHLKYYLFLETRGISSPVVIEIVNFSYFKLPPKLLHRSFGNDKQVVQ